MSDSRPAILVVCIHNSARSQMAEALIRHHCGAHVTVESAGLEPGTLNPLAVEVLRELGIDIQGKATQSAFALAALGRRYETVITVCDESQAERCPIFPGQAQRLHWSFPDPSTLQGSWQERLAQTRHIRDQIEARVRDWCAERA